MPNPRPTARHSNPRARLRAAAPRRPRTDAPLSTGLAAAIIVVTGCVAYHNSFSGPFIFDDLVHIVDNPHIRHLWPPSLVLSGTARPVAMLTLALNYAIGGLAVSGYHATNLAFHLLAALTLFGIVRRTFTGPRLRERYSSAATGLALAAAALWVSHPLNTQAVTYVIQRGESLAGLFYLVTLYATIRGASSRRARGWYAVAVAVCALGAATKPVLVSAPIVILFYDRFFLAESFRAAFQRRGALYCALAATWVVMIALARMAPDAAAGLQLTTVTPVGYAATQPGVVLHYLRLAFWPHPLVLDYGWPPAIETLSVVTPSLVVASIVAATLWATARLYAPAFLGLWFVLVLAPSSSVFPINDLAFEHRMYLPLAAVIVLAVVAGHTVLVRRARSIWAARALAILGVVVLCALTIRRNADYRSEISIWNDVVVKRPLNARGHMNLGRAWLRVNDVERAMPELLAAVNLAPRYALAHNNLGGAVAAQGDLDAAIIHYHDALALNPDFADAHYNLGLALAGQSRFDDAIRQYQEALRVEPTHAAAWDATGNAYARSGRLEQAIHSYREALRVDSDLARAHNNLGLALAASGRWDEAIESHRKAILLRPEVADFHVNLGSALAGRGLLNDAIAAYEAGLTLSPGAPQIHNNIGIILTRQGKLDEGIAQFREALRLKPEFSLARRNLENAMARQGKASEAAR